MTVVACLETAEWETEQLRGAFAQHPELEPRFLPGRLAEHLDEVADAPVLSTFIYSRVDAAALERLPAARLVATRSTGFDHIDLEAAAARGVSVCNVPTYGENTVAEHTFALILALSRRLLRAERRGRHGETDLAGLQGFDLKDKVLGVVGAGRIGLHVIRIGRAFGMRVLAADPHREDLLAEVLGFEYADLGDLLERSDVVTLHAPGAGGTRHLIGAEELERMKPGAVLVNTARGGLVDTEALIAALDRGHLGGAGLDVFEGEHTVTEDYGLLSRPAEDLRVAFGRRLLADRDDVILTPHNAFNSYEAVERIAETTVENIACFLAGEPRNVVT